MRFDAVAFDLDGTLYPDSSLYRLALPVVLGKKRVFLAFRSAREKMRELVLDGGNGDAHPKDGAEFRARQAAFVANSLGVGEDEASSMLERDFYRGIEELFSRVSPFPGVKPALEALLGGGVRTALLSDLPPARKLERLGLSGFFEVALCSEDSGALKPARAPFSMLASHLALAPERILYVGNSPRIDLLGAKAAGMSAAVVSRRRIRGADLSFYDWKKLVEYAFAEA
jgi:putative hydrolase of the HAD superfamily